MKERKRVQVSFEGEEVLTEQSHRDLCDVNKIIERAKHGGVLSHVNTTNGVFIDVPEVDFQDALQLVIEAQSSFAGLPAKVRDRFNNDPVALFRFLGDEGNRDEAIKLGLIDQPQKPAEPVKEESDEREAKQKVEQEKSTT